MKEKYYSVEQISEMLNIHPKTIQRYIREGRLRAGKIGKSWRVTGHDLSVFIESTKLPTGKETFHSIKKSGYEIKVSSVIDIDVEGMDDAIRIMNTVTAAEYQSPGIWPSDHACTVLGIRMQSSCHHMGEHPICTGNHSINYGIG